MAGDLRVARCSLRLCVPLSLLISAPFEKHDSNQSACDPTGTSIAPYSGADRGAEPFRSWILRSVGYGKSVQRAWHAARPHVNGVPLGRGEKAAIANKKNPGRERPGLSLPVAERGLLHGCGGF
jgi:hypothetical protein